MTDSFLQLLAILLLIPPYQQAGSSSFTSRKTPRALANCDVIAKTFLIVYTVWALILRLLTLQSTTTWHTMPWGHLLTKGALLASKLPSEPCLNTFFKVALV
jgi:hypothetical protein